MYFELHTVWYPSYLTLGEWLPSNLKLHSSDIPYNTPSTHIQVHRYPKLYTPNNHNRNIIEHVNDNETCELTSTGTQDTVPIVNGYSPEQSLGGKKET